MAPNHGKLWFMTAILQALSKVDVINLKKDFMENMCPRFISSSRTGEGMTSSTTLKRTYIRFTLVLLQLVFLQHSGNACFMQFTRIFRWSSQLLSVCQNNLFDFISPTCRAMHNGPKPTRGQRSGNLSISPVNILPSLEELPDGASFIVGTNNETDQGGWIWNIVNVFI